MRQINTDEDNESKITLNREGADRLEKHWDWAVLTMESQDRRGRRAEWGGTQGCAD